MPSLPQNPDPTLFPRGTAPPASASSSSIGGPFCPLSLAATATAPAGVGTGSRGVARGLPASSAGASRNPPMPVLP